MYTISSPELNIPELYCPFSYPINEYANALERYSLEWVLRFNLLPSELSYQRFARSKFFLLSASVYPYAQLEELKIANDWISWLFIWDDYCDVSDLGKHPAILEKFLKRFLEILNGAELKSEDTPLGHALGNLRQRMLQRGNKKWFHHFVQSVKNYFDGCVREAINRAAGVVPDLMTYPIIRSLTGAMHSVIDLIEFCEQLILEDFLREHQIIKQLTLMTNNIVCWANDVISVSKEMEKGDVHNLVIVLHYQRQISLREAVIQAIEIHNQEVRDMLNIEASLPKFGRELDTKVTTYISGMHSWISGNLTWGSGSARYQALEKVEIRESLQ